MATSQQYAATVRNANGQISLANTARDGTGTLVNVFSAGASGSRIDSITVTATVTTTAGMVRLFIFDGTNNRLFAEIPVQAITVSGTVPAFSANINSAQHPDLMPIFLQSTHILKAAPNNAETFNVIAQGGDF